MKEAAKVKSAKKPPVRTAKAKVAATQPRSDTSTSPRKRKIADGIPPQQRFEMIAQAAYFRAAQRGFCPGNELEDWVQAEAEIEQLLASR